MSLIDELRQSRESRATAFDDFIRRRTRGGVHAFVEGDDDAAFYRKAIQQVCIDGQPIFFYKCGGKRSVYAMRQKIERIKSTHCSGWDVTITILYFVDKDLSEFLPEKQEQFHDVYVTDYYSIENYLISEEIFKVVLTDCFSCPQGTLPIEEELLVSHFREALKVFHEAMKYVMAWLIYLHRGDQRYEAKRISLDQFIKFKPDLAVEFTCSGASHYSKILDHQCGLSTCDNYTLSEASLLHELEGAEPKKYIRGKFEIWFLFAFTSEVARLLKPKQVKFNATLISERNVVKFLAPRLHPVPASLQEFLKASIK